MEEKKVTKISLSTFFLILAIIIIIVMGIFMYKLYNEKTIEIEKSAQLQTQLNSLNETENTEVKTTAELKFEEAGYRYPRFHYGDNAEDTNSWEYASFIFSEDGKVEYVDYQSVFKGTYKIVNDKIECDFEEFASECGSNEKGKFDKDITLTLISDDKIIGSILEKRENSEDEESELYWGIQKVVYEFQSL